MRLDEFLRVTDELHRLGFAHDDIAWSENAKPPVDAEQFALEAIYVICNSGMKNSIARAIYEKCRDAVEGSKSAHGVFGHEGKATAIDRIWRRRERYFADYLAAGDKIEYLGSLPWIGGITKYHLAKNFGIDCVKPDVHLQRLANHYGTTPHKLCEALTADTGYKLRTVDLLLWRACANGVINSRTGQIKLTPAPSGTG